MSSDPLYLVVFDYDGTLVDSHPGFHQAFAAAFVAIGVRPPEMDATRSIVGLPLREALTEFVPDATQAMLSEFSQAMRRARKFMRNEDKAPDTLIPGTRTVIETLEEAGVLMAIATNKSRKGLDHSLEYHGIAKYFVATRTADDGHAKPHPQMLNDLISFSGARSRHAVVVGDTSVDMEMAANASVPAVGVTWGYHDAEVLREAGAAQVIDRYAELGPALEKIWMVEPPKAAAG